MSSHHFVREGQEPALIIIDAIDYERVAPLLEWAPFVLVHERSLEEVLSWGIKIDGVICRKETVALVSEMIVDQLPFTIVEVDAGTDEVRYAIEFVINHNHDAACIVMVSENGMQQMESASANINITLLMPELKWSLIRNGRFEKWVLKGQKFFLQPSTRLREKANVIPQGNQLIAEQDGVIRLASDRPFWLGEEY